MEKWTRGGGEVLYKYEKVCIIKWFQLFEKIIMNFLQKTSLGPFQF